MSCEKRNIFKIAAVYTCTVLGAGFASGKELVSFFVCHGVFGAAGITLSGVFFSLICFCVLKISYEHNITDYRDFSAYIAGKRFGALFEWLVCAFLLVLYAAMISACGEMSRIIFNTSRAAGEIVLSLLCFAAFLFPFGGFVNINAFFAPILTAGGIFIGLYIYFFSPESAETFGAVISSILNNDNFIISALIYVSYNIITAVTVLVSLNDLIVSKKVYSAGSVLGGACIMLLGLCISLPLFSCDKIRFSDMPVLSLVLDYGAVKYIYILILFLAIFTTALANGFSLIRNFDSKKGGRLFIKIFIAVWGLAAAQIGFSSFIDKVYPVFGIIGLLEGFMIVCAAFAKP